MADEGQQQPTPKPSGDQPVTLRVEVPTSLKPTITDKSGASVPSTATPAEPEKPAAPKPPTAPENQPNAPAAPKPAINQSPRPVTPTSHPQGTRQPAESTTNARREEGTQPNRSGSEPRPVNNQSGSAGDGAPEALAPKPGQAPTIDKPLPPTAQPPGTEKNATTAAPVGQGGKPVDKAPDQLNAKKEAPGGRQSKPQSNRRQPSLGPRQSFGQRVQAGLSQYNPLKLLSGNTTKKIGSLLSRSWLFYGLIAVLAIGLIIAAVLAISFIGSPQSTPKASANAVTNRCDVLVFLSKAGDAQSKAQYLRDCGDPLLAQLQKDSDAEKDATKKKVIDRYRSALQTVFTKTKGGTDYSKDPLPSPLKEEKAEAIAAYQDYVNKVGGGIPLVLEYMKLANQNGSDLNLVPSAAAGTVFNSTRSANEHRNAGPHNGYDLFSASKTGAVVIGWPGTIVAFEDWGGTYGWATVEQYTNNGKTYSIKYGHMNYAQGSSQRGTPFLQKKGTTQKVPIELGKTQVEPGDIIGYIYSPMAHVDIKWVRNSDKQYVDWGKSPVVDHSGNE